ncbi:HopJ type III effector protein [Aliivibrio fischeri]|uniref:HopJ type III effector protein n=1 Tax=Aliivibrio fischeri TaxID=668 RepID=UPI0006CFFA23|nr:HopJ type III effector protein [Aliivibrio fischeri]MUK26657.1 type III effector [Aliivibrio fischeri]MUK32945.1 type III effector [Aliivibrio fischeri]USR96936.1 HopJ type III effector protein [Aliivibrio fischeri ATCC 7744 = JCM 18803 = DSM 507]
MMTLNAFIEKLSTQPELIEFTETMAVIESHYDFTPTEFANGNTVNLADQNNGSCKIFAFALLNQLSVDQTLACFGQYYRHDVLENPQGDDHQNIRNFMVTGWAGVQFKTQALQAK